MRKTDYPSQSSDFREFAMHIAAKQEQSMGRRHRANKPDHGGGYSPDDCERKIPEHTFVDLMFEAFVSKIRKVEIPF